MSFCVGSYSLELMGHLSGYESLPLANLAVKWAGIILSIACLTKLSYDLTERSAFSADGGKRLRSLLRPWHGKFLVVSFATSEILSALSIIPFAFAFRPYGIFMLTGGSLAAYGLIMQYKLQRGNVIGVASIAAASVYTFFFWLIMNPFFAFDHDVDKVVDRRFIFIGKLGLWALALAATGAKAWHDPAVLDSICDTELWSSPVLLILAVLGLLGYLSTGFILWRRGFFHKADGIEYERV